MWFSLNSCPSSSTSFPFSGGGGHCHPPGTPTQLNINKTKDDPGVTSQGNSMTNSRLATLSLDIPFCAVVLLMEALQVQS